MLEDTSVALGRVGSETVQMLQMVDGVSEDKDLSWEARKERYVAGRWRPVKNGRGFNCG